MNLQDLANLAQAVGAATVVGGTVFALVQFFEYKKQRQRTRRYSVNRSSIACAKGFDRRWKAAPVGCISSNQSSTSGTSSRRSM